jgi:cytochrome c peroxidase
MSGTVSVLDAQTLEPHGELQVGGQPWAVTALADDHRVYVTDFSAGDVKLADLDTGGVAQSVDLTQSTSAECPNGIAPPRQPAQAADVILSPEGDRAYVAHVQSRTNGAFGQQTSLAFAVAPALSTIDTSQNSTFQEQQTNGVGDDPNQGFPASMLATNLDTACQWVNHNDGMDAPSSLVVDGMGDWIFVADHNSNAIAVVSSTRRNDARFRVPDRGIADVVAVGARPTGIAISGDLKHAYVHNALDYSVSVIENVNGQLTTSATIPFATSDLPADVERGRRLFYSAVDSRVTQPELGGVSCSSCHPEGRTDALSWMLPPPSGTNWFDQNSTEPRNTPALWGVTHTAPYHWDGSSTDLSTFSTGMVSQMGGAGLDPRDVSDLTAFMATLKEPDHPALGAQAPALIARGQQIFQASCGNCHSGDELTDGLQHPSTAAGAPLLNTPSLRGAFATAPYLHDGSAPTLRAVFTGYATVQGHDQSALSAADLEALEAYVDAQ